MIPGIHEATAIWALYSAGGMNTDLILKIRIVFEKFYFPGPLLPRHPFAQTYTYKDVPGITGKRYKTRNNPDVHEQGVR